MRNLILTILAAAACLTARAQQWDSLYYRPDKEVAAIKGVAFDEHMERLGGNTLHVIETIPEGTPKGVVYIYHGNAENLTGRNMQRVMSTLTAAGYTARAFDYPGFGRSTGTPTHAAIGEAAREHFRRTVSDDDTPVIIYGRSIGTQIAATIAAENSDRVRGLVLDGGSPSFKALALIFAPVEVHHLIEQYMTDPYSVAEALPRLEKTDVRVFFIHSVNDHIPYSDIRRLYDTFKGKKTFWSYDGYHIDAATLYPDAFLSHIDSLARGR